MDVVLLWVSLTGCSWDNAGTPRLSGEEGGDNSVVCNGGRVFEAALLFAVALCIFASSFVSVVSLWFVSDYHLILWTKQQELVCIQGSGENLVHRPVQYLYCDGGGSDDENPGSLLNKMFWEEGSETQGFVWREATDWQTTRKAKMTRAMMTQRIKTTTKRWKMTVKIHKETQNCCRFKMTWEWHEVKVSTCSFTTGPQQH